MGPMMFIMYINDLGTYLVDSKVSLYADDTALYSSAGTQIELVLNLRVELSIVGEWLKANWLTLNTKKNKYVVFGTKHKLEHFTQDLNITIGNDKIERVKHMKYLLQSNKPSVQAICPDWWQTVNDLHFKLHAVAASRQNKT